MSTLDLFRTRRALVNMLEGQGPDSPNAPGIKFAIDLITKSIEDETEREWSKPISGEPVFEHTE